MDTHFVSSDAFQPSLIIYFGKLCHFVRSIYSYRVQPVEPCHSTFCDGYDLDESCPAGDLGFTPSAIDSRHGI
jgi:hypothetical protein